MKSIIYFITILTFGIISAQNTLSRIELTVSYDEDRKCDMTPLGQISIKVCGQNCCFRNIVGSSYYEGQSYTFSGPYLEECHNFELGPLNEGEAQATIYHHGTDAICLSEVTFYVNDSLSKYVKCSFMDVMIDGNMHFNPGTGNCTVTGGP